jgi:hypothetical protein
MLQPLNDPVQELAEAVPQPSFTGVEEGESNLLPLSDELDNVEFERIVEVSHYLSTFHNAYIV